MPPPGGSGGDHARSAAFLSGHRPKKTAGTDISIGSATIDQQIAQKIGQETLLPSMQFAIEDPGGQVGTCGWGYSCAYVNTISWSDHGSPMPMEINPQVVFERMFGDGGTPEERAGSKNHKTQRSGFGHEEGCALEGRSAGERSQSVRRLPG